jgi:nucleoside-diphosphate-sugar epimerase
MTSQLRRVFSRSGLDDAELLQLVDSCESTFRSLADASILITGATGWFGVWLLDVLCMADDALRLGIRITAISRKPSRFLERFRGFVDDPRITWINMDVRELESVGSGYSHVIHAAADTSIKSAPEAPLHLFDTIIEGTRRVIAAAGSECKSILLLSSGAVYGPARPNNARFVETDVGGGDPSLVKNAYAEGKRGAEQLGAIAATMGGPIRIARCFAFVGPHMPFDGHFAVGNFIADAVHGRSIRIKSDGLPQRSYLYMTDLIRALLMILVSGPVGRPYNVGSDMAVSIEQLAHCVDRVVGGRGLVVEGAASDPSDRYVPDTSRLRRELDFEPEVSLEMAIARTAAWYRARINGSVSS